MIQTTKAQAGRMAETFSQSKRNVIGVAFFSPCGHVNGSHEKDWEYPLGFPLPHILELTSKQEVR